MISGWLMKLLLAQYVGIAFFQFLEGNPRMAFYFFGAAVIQASVMGLK